MIKEALQWKSKDELDLFGYKWVPDEPKAVIGLVHGIGEHCERYHHMAEFYSKNNIAVIAFDHRGHGKSGGKRGHTPSYAMLMYDMHHFMDQIRSTFADLPVFLYGHSFGGNVVSNFVLAEQPDIKGAILSGPYFKLGFEPPASKVKLARTMNKIYGAFTDKTKLDATAISKDEEVVKKYVDDPLVHDKMTARMFVDSYDAGNWALRNATKLHVPALVMHGSEDRLTSVKGSEEFVDAAGALATLKIWDGLFHEIHNEPEQQQVFNYALAWLEQRI